MFMSPVRSELKAIVRPSPDQAPRLSSRVVAMSCSGGPAGRPVSGDDGQPPDVGVLAQRREGEAASVGRQGHLHVLPRALGELLQASDRLP